MFSNTYCIGLGGNIGNVEHTFDRAMSRLDDGICRVTAQSRVHRSVPMGESAGGEFRNATIRVESNLDPQSMLRRLQRIEDENGRQRGAVWGPRTLDLDLLLSDDQIIDSDNLVVPHPGLWYRRFVLDPLMEIAADDHHPELGMTIRELRQRLNWRPLVIEVADECIPACRIDRVEIRPADGSSGNRESQVFARIQADNRIPPATVNRRQESGFVVRCHPLDVESTVMSVATAALGE